MLPQGNISVQELAAALIRSFEGCRLISYQDPGGKWTIGYGHTGPVNGQPLGPGVSITEDQAEALLALDAAPLIEMVKDQPLIAAAAYVSFGYNCGASRLRDVLAGQVFMTQFCHDSNGVTLPGLLARRNLEELLTITANQK